MRNHTASIVAICLSLCATVVDAATPPTTQAVSYHVRYRYQLKNRMNQALENVRVYIPLPQSCPYQEIVRLDLIFPQQGCKTEGVEDQFGQKFAEIAFPKLDPRASVEVGFECDFRLRPRRRISLDAGRVQTLKDIPGDLQGAYTSDLAGVYDLTSPEIRKTSSELIARRDNLLDQIAAIHDFVAAMKYVRDQTWDAAPVVLRRMTGSCSEFSFLFCALCRAAGIPTRFVAGTTCRIPGSGRWPYTDDVYHRWVEVYVPPYGWVPFDVTRDRGRPPKRDYFGAHPTLALILSRGGGGSRYLKNQYIGWNTHAMMLERKREFLWSIAQPATRHSAGPPVSSSEGRDGRDVRAD
jgi:hypothetical protein